MKILFISSSIKSKFNPLLIAFKKIYSNIDVIFFPDHSMEFIDKLRFKTYCHKAISQYNKNIILHLNQNNNYDFTIVVKGMYLYYLTSKKLRLSTNHMVYWSNDDIIRPHNNSWFLRKSLKLYDKVFTMKIQNIINDEFRRLNVKNTDYLIQCYSDELAMNLNKARSSLIYDVSFIGFYEKYRFETIKFLADNGITINIFGNGWDKIKEKKIKNLIFHNPVLGDSYRNTINKSKISLCFLRKKNNDSITVRSVEIPAYGGFILGEYSVEHSYLLLNEKEAIWCKTNHDFLKKINFYLKNEVLREKIAISGNKRIRQINCSYEEQVRHITKCLFNSNGN